MKNENLCTQVARAEIDAGCSECSAWSHHKEYYSPMISFYRSCGEDDFNLEMMVRYGEHSFPE